MNTEDILKQLLIDSKIEPDGQLGKHLMDECKKELESVIDKAVKSYGTKQIKAKAVRFFSGPAKKKNPKNPAKSGGGEANQGGNPVRPAQHSNA